MASSDEKFGTELGLMHEVLIMGRKVGADREFWKTLSRGEDMFRRVVELVKEMSELEAFRVVVDYSKPLVDMIKAGKYDWGCDGIIPEHFPFGKAEGSKEIEIQIVHLGLEATTREVLAELDNRGLRPATLAELLALGAQHLELQRRFWVVALDSSCRNSAGHVFVPSLGATGGMRGIQMCWLDQDIWRETYRFAAVRK